MTSGRRTQLIVNPFARAVTPASVAAIRRVFEPAFPIDIVSTTSPYAAASVAREAAESGTGLVIAFGGDGLVNEVVNGLVGTPAALGVVPGGTMNVFARSLGIPRQPVEAARVLVEHAQSSVSRGVDLGRANGRYFTFACGCGFDAEVAERVNGHRRAKHRLGEAYFYAAALATLATSYAVRAPYLRCEGDFGEREGVMAIVLVGRPYAYLAGRPVRLGRSRSTAPGLSLFVVRDMRLWRVPEYAAGAVLSGRLGPGAELLHGVHRVRVSSEPMVPVHVDGERLLPAPAVEIGRVEQALQVLA
jgi:diacylglycerol kinase family enzyme